jgi:hypothetical protein
MKRWNREILFTYLDSIFDTYSIGQKYQYSETPYIVLKGMSQSVGNNIIGGWQYYRIMCYVPDTSISELDGMIEIIKSNLKGTNLEITGTLSEDYKDTEISMYMRYVDIRIPKEV